MGFSLCPDDGPPRLWRFVDDQSLGHIGGRPVLAMLLPGNILKIDRGLYEQLNWIDQHQLLRTHRDFTVIA